MALGAREIYLVIRARDEASRTLNSVAATAGKINGVLQKQNALSKDYGRIAGEMRSKADADVRAALLALEGLTDGNNRAVANLRDNMTVLRRQYADEITDIRNVARADLDANRERVSAARSRHAEFVEGERAASAVRRQNFDIDSEANRKEIAYRVAQANAIKQEARSRVSLINETRAAEIAANTESIDGHRRSADEAKKRFASEIMGIRKVARADLDANGLRMAALRTRQAVILDSYKAADALGKVALSNEFDRNRVTLAQMAEQSNAIRQGARFRVSAINEVKTAELAAHQDSIRQLKERAQNLHRHHADEIANIRNLTKLDLDSNRQRITSLQARQSEISAAFKENDAAGRSALAHEHQRNRLVIGQLAEESAAIRQGARTRVAAINEVKDTELRAIDDSILGHQRSTDAATKRFSLFKRDSADALQAGLADLDRQKMAELEAIDLADKKAARARAMPGILMGVGQATAMVGAGFGLMGGAALIGFNMATNAAAEFDKQARLTFTQVNQGGVTLENIKKISLDVAKSIPAPFEELQPALYAIFSSITVTAEDAGKALKLFAKAGVAGMVEVEKAAIGAFTIMNNFGLGVADLPRILDAQFKLVQQGIGTYEQVSSVIGQLSQGADRAGQSIETMSGALAFASRVTGSMATGATELKNLLNALGKTPVQDKLKEIGVAVVGADGNFRQLKDIMNDTAKAMDNMTGPEREAKIQAIFKTGSTSAQQVTKLVGSMTSNIGGLNTVMDEVARNAGSMELAFQRMDGPAAKAQMLKNKMEMLKIEIGDRLMPAKIKLMEVITKLMDKWDSLSPKTKDAIIKFAAIAAVVATVLGAVLLLVGGAAMLIGAVAGIVGSVGAAIAVIGGIAAAVVVAGGALFIFRDKLDDVGRAIDGFFGGLKGFIDNFKMPELNLPKVDLGGIFGTIKNPFQDFVAEAKTSLSELWGSLSHGVKDTMATFKATIGTEAKVAWKIISDELALTGQDIGRHLKQIQGEVLVAFNEIRPQVQKVWSDLGNDLAPVGENIGKAFNAAATVIADVFYTLKETVKAPMNEIADIVETVADDITAWWNKSFDKFAAPVREAITQVITAFREVTPPVIEAFGHVVNAVKVAMQMMWTIVKPWLVMIYAAFQVAMLIIRTTVEASLTVILAVWKSVGDEILAIVTVAWGMIWNVISTFLKVIRGIIMTVLHLINGDWGKAWDAFYSIFEAIWDGIIKHVKGVVKILFNIVKGIVTGIFDFFKWLWDALVGHSIIPDMINGIIDWFKKLPGRLFELVKDAVMKVVTTFAELAMKVIPALGQFVETVVRFFTDLPGKIIGALGDLAGLLRDKGVALLQGLLNGIVSLSESVFGFYRELPGKVVGAVGDVGSLLFNKGKAILQSAIDGWVIIAETAWNFYRELPGKIVGFVGDVSKLLWEKGKQILQSAIDGWLYLGETAWNFFRKLPGKITDSVGHVANLLFTKGKEILQSAINGWVNIAENLWNIFKNLPGQIINTVGYLGNTLLQAGKDLINGFIRGIEERRDNGLWGVLKGITTAIPLFKGPIDKDRRLLVENGSAIMDGLIKGIESREGALKIALARIMAIVQQAAVLQQQAAPSIEQLGHISEDDPRWNPATMGNGLWAEYPGGPIQGTPRPGYPLPPGYNANAMTTSSVVVEEGAVQVQVQGNVDQGTMPELQRMLDEAMRNLAEQLARRK